MGNGGIMTFEVKWYWDKLNETVCSVDDELYNEYPDRFQPITREDAIKLLKQHSE